MFSFEFVVWGNYIKRSVDFIYGGSLPCWAKTWNIHDLYTIAVEQDDAIVGHGPKQYLSHVFSFYKGEVV